VLREGQVLPTGINRFTFAAENPCPHRLAAGVRAHRLTKHQIRVPAFPRERPDIGQCAGGEDVFSQGTLAVSHHPDRKLRQAAVWSLSSPPRIRSNLRARWAGLQRDDLIEDRPRPLQ